MRHVFTASRLMTAGEIQKQCKEIRGNPLFLMYLEAQIKRRIFEEKRKAASEELIALSKEVMKEIEKLRSSKYDDDFRGKQKRHVCNTCLRLNKNNTISRL